MRYFLVLSIILFSTASLLSGQSRTELEEQRKRALDEISYVDNMLKSTEKEKEESISSLRMLGNKLNLRESVLRGMIEEIELLNERIAINRLAFEMMETDLVKLKDDYSRAIINSYKLKKSNPDIVYILSARDFNQGYKRIKYLQQVSKFRRYESEIIAELKQQIEGTKERLESDLENISDLRKREEQQKSLLKGEQSREQRLLKSLQKKEQQLKKELDEKRRIAQRIENEIARVIEEERKRELLKEVSPEEKLTGENFADNRGRLPWPVENGVITSHFGTHQHPVLKYVTEENKGIEITSQSKTAARSVFKGEVSLISLITGANMTVIIKHGNYYSVYSNLVNVKVKKGDKVDTKQIVGDVYENPREENRCVLKFMIFEEKKALDPESWITKI
jgi:septal ring factor EnvC (AmiA/AmiB activator)